MFSKPQMTLGAKRHTEGSMCKRLVVAAIDFGTTYSGYAFSFKSSPIDVRTNHSWVAGSEKLISLKTPTCVLLQPDKQFHSFGYEAENKYMSLAEDDEHHGWLLFRRFKMLLYTTEALNRNTQIDDISGKPYRALDIFTMSIRYLKDHLMDTLNNQTVGIGLDDVEFVITVPAIWDDKAKQFMREAAIQAGIPTGQLKFALEAASLWGQHISSNKQMPGAQKGDKYMVVDLGGGTADITVHEKFPDGTLREIHKASGGAWGGNEVDKNYIKMLADIITKETMDNFKKEQLGDYFDVLRDFETKKRTVTNDKEGKLTFRIAASMREMFEKKGKTMKSRVSEMDYGQKLTWSADKIRLHISVAKMWFKKPIDDLVKHVTSLLRQEEMKDVAKILLVGGFGECDLVQSEFRNKINKRFIIPDDAGLAVLKGAVLYGHLPGVISSRKAKTSYGIDLWSEFNVDTHPESKRKTLSSGKVVCTDVYNEMVSIGEEISFGQKYQTVISPHLVDGTPLIVPVYSSTTTSPTYTTDRGCKRLGAVTVNLPDGTSIKEKKCTVEFCFGGTELFVTVRIHKTGEIFEKTIDCM